jgi:predicted nuclease of predicted toxin-antitoxin system
VDRGHEATHVFDLALHKADDPVIWDRAQSENAIIIRKHQDFVDHWILSDRPVALVWIRKMELFEPGFDALMEWLELLWPDTLDRLERGEQLIELRE